MDDILGAKSQIRGDMARMLSAMTEDTVADRTSRIEERLFGFANFQEARIPLLYISVGREVNTRRIISRCYGFNKMVILPLFEPDTGEARLLKIDDPSVDLRPGSAGVRMPDPNRCKEVPLECIDIAILPGLAFDEKGGRLGGGDGTYDRLIPKLPITTRKVALTFEDQILGQIPMEPHDRHVDIIITESRIIYKI